MSLRVVQVSILAGPRRRSGTGCAKMETPSCFRCLPSPPSAKKTKFLSYWNKNEKLPVSAKKHPCRTALAEELHYTRTSFREVAEKRTLTSAPRIEIDSFGSRCR